MYRSFSEMLARDGKKNSLGLVPEVIEVVLADKTRLEELYQTIFHGDAWVRMRAIDAFEKICRVHTDWVQPYISRIQKDLSGSTQPSIQWHIAQIYAQVELDDTQKKKAVDWLTSLIQTIYVDWIVSANCMTTLAGFVRDGTLDRTRLNPLLVIQTGHKSNAVIKRSTKLLLEFT